MNPKILLGSLALDLERVASSYHNGSLETAKTFSAEALKRKKELKDFKLEIYIQDLLNKLDAVLSQKKPDDIAEDALMYSTLFQNAALNEFS